MRQTCLDVSKLEAAMNSGEKRPCFCTNEIGEILADDGASKEEKERAMSVLMKMIRGEDPCAAIAYCWLDAAVEKPPAAARIALQEFESNPGNAKTLELAQAMMRSTPS